MSVARRFAAALAVVGLGVLAYAVPASATGGDSSESCITNPTADDLVANLYPFQGIARVRAADGVNVCADVLLSIYSVPDTWKGRDFNESATPQTLLSTAAGTVGEGKLELTVPVRDCGNMQIDLYFPPEITEVSSAGHGTQLILGKIWRTYDGAGNLKPCVPTPTPTETETSTPPVPTPTETETSTPPVPTPTETETSTPPVPTPTETESTTPAPTTTVPVPQPTEGLGAPITILPPPSPPVTPVLAETGSNSTVPLLGIGLALLGAGIGLSLLGRRRTA